jgi:transposase
MRETNMTAPARQLCAGIDVGKHWLDMAVAGENAVSRFANSPEGHAALIAALRQKGAGRVGLEATGGYEQDIVEALRASGFEVHVFQPAQVRAYAAYKGQRAKSDKIDARLIARCTAELDQVRPAPDPRFRGFSAALTLIDQMGEDIIRAKTRAEHVKDPEIKAYHKGEIKRLRAAVRKAYARLVREVKAHDGLKARLALIESIDGIGVRTALNLLIRMPELGAISREEAASLIGLAPVVRESGAYKGERHVQGGRMRPRTAVFACAQAAIKWNRELKAFYARLMSRGKHHRAAIAACARKLVIFANTVLKRQTKWQSQTAN